MNCKENAKSVIREMFLSDCASLFQHYGCDAIFCDDIAESEEIHAIGVIDAGCDELELSLMLNIPFSILALSYPCQEVIVDLPEEQLEDWLLELANQLMGKLKNRLVNQNFAIKLGLPDSYFDVDTLTENSFLSSHDGYLFEVDGVRMECWLHVDIKTDSIQLSNDANEEAFSGEIELF